MTIAKNTSRAKQAIANAHDIRVYSQADMDAARTQAHEAGYRQAVAIGKCNADLVQQLTILCDWVDKHGLEYCRCENNGDYCDFHEMLAEAREALK